MGLGWLAAPVGCARGDGAGNGGIERAGVGGAIAFAGTGLGDAVGLGEGSDRLSTGGVDTGPG